MGGDIRFCVDNGPGRSIRSGDPLYLGRALVLEDAHGLTLSTTSAETVRAFDHTIAGYLKNRADTAQRLSALIQLDPELGMGHVLKGYLLMLGFNEALVGVARASEAVAAKLAGAMNSREAAHLAALRSWIDGDIERTLRGWEEILAAHPRDVLAFRLHHFLAFWFGKPDLMVRTVEAVLPHWTETLPGFGSMLACRAFAHEETGSYTIAEAAGRAAIEVDPGDVWATHAIAHVLEMQGRRSEGIAWLKGLEPNWDGANNLMHHLWWHRALFHLERGEHAEVLALYDQGFRNLSAPLTKAQPDLYIDVQNAASMLYRLGRQGVDVGARWEELADKAEARIGDCLNPFTLPHWMMALAGAGRWSKAQAMLDAMRAVASRNGGTIPPLVRNYALPICEAVLANARGEPAVAVARMAPAIGGMYRLGGSHAQQDVLEQVFLDAALKADDTAAAGLLLERVVGRNGLPLERRVGYRAAAKAVLH
jgi:tetratricopeptide (TPR) repeat protein